MYPVESLETMVRIVALVERENYEKWNIRRYNQGVVYPTSIAIGYSACHAAEMVNAIAIICLTQSGSTAEMIARFRPNAPIYAISPNKAAYLRTALMWDVRGYLTEEFSDKMGYAVQDIIEMLLKDKTIKKGDNLVFTAGIPFYKKRDSNMLRIETA